MRTYWVLGEEPSHRLMRLSHKVQATPPPTYTSIKSRDTSAVSSTPRTSRHSSLGHHTHLHKIPSTPVLTNAADTVAPSSSKVTDTTAGVPVGEGIGTCAFSKLPLMVPLGNDDTGTCRSWQNHVANTVYLVLLRSSTSCPKFDKEHSYIVQCNNKYLLLVYLKGCRYVRNFNPRPK